MANTLGLLFKLSADDSGVEAALKALKADMATVDQGVKQLAKSLNLLPSEAAALVKEISAIENESQRAAEMLKRFGDAGLKAAGDIDKLGRQMADVEKRQTTLTSQTTKANEAFRNFGQQGLSAVTNSLGPMGQALDNVSKSFGAAGIAITAVVGGLAAAVKVWSDTAGKIHDVALETNFTAEAISGLQVAAATGGVSMDELASAIVRFQRAAVEGTDEARQAFKNFGLTAEKAAKDPQGAFDTFLKNFNELGPSAQRTADVMAIFGRGAARLTPAFEDAAGGIQKLIDKARDLGILMTKESVKAADEFGDQLAILELQLKGMAVTVVEKTSPAFKAFDKIIQDALVPSRTYKENIEGINNALDALAKKKAGELLQPAPITQPGGKLPPTFSKEEQEKLFQQEQALRYEAQREAEKKAEEARKKAEAERKKAADEAARKAKQAAEKLKQDTIKQNEEAIKKRLEQAEAAYEQEKQLLDAALKDQLISVDNYTERAKVAYQLLAIARREALAAQREIDLSQQTNLMGQLAVNTKYAADMQKTYNDQLKETTGLDAEAERLLQKKLEELEKQRKEVERQTEALDKQRAAWEKLVEGDFVRRMREGAQVPVEGMAGSIMGAEVEGRIRLQAQAVSDLTRVWRELRNEIIKSAEALSQNWAKEAGIVFDESGDKINLLGSIANQLMISLNDFVQGFAKGIGSLVQQYVLLGTTGPAAMKKLLAATLASVAAEAAVRAVFATALGFYLLALQDYADAAKAFTAAAVWAGIAVGTGLAGRAIAGNAEQARGAGQFGGTPAPVTINQGAGAGGALGVRPDVVLQADMMSRQVSALETFNAKFNATTPGNVIVAGAGERPDAVATATLEQSRRDSGFGRELLSNWGVT